MLAQRLGARGDLLGGNFRGSTTGSDGDAAGHLPGVGELERSPAGQIVFQRLRLAEPGLGMLTDVVEEHTAGSASRSSPTSA